MVVECQLGSSGGVACSLRETYFLRIPLSGVYLLFVYLGVVWLKPGLAELARGIRCCPIFFLFPLPSQRLHIMKNMCVYIHISDSLQTIQGVTGGTDQTSGECSLGQTIPI